MIPDAVERRARWVLDTIGARELGFGDDVPYGAEAWEQVERGERPDGRRPRGGVLPPRPGRGAKRGAGRARPLPRGVVLPRPARSAARTAACADSVLEPPRWGGARFAVALTHDVDVPWKWTRLGVKGAAARAKTRPDERARRPGAARAARARRRAPCTGARHRSVLELRPRSSRTSGAAGRRRRSSCSPTTRTSSTAPRPRRTSGCGRGSSRRSWRQGARSGSTAATRPQTTPSGSRTRRSALERLSGPVQGQRYHYLRVDPHRNLGALEAAGFAYDSSLGFGGRGRLPGRDRASVPAVGLRAGRAARSDRGPARGDGRDARPPSGTSTSASSEAGARLERAARLGRGARGRLRDPVALGAVRLRAPAADGTSSIAA